MHLYGTTQDTQWHTGCMCCFDQLRVYWKAWSVVLMLDSECGSLLLGAANGSFWILPLARDVLPSSPPHLLSPLLIVLLPLSHSLTWTESFHCLLNYRPVGFSLERAAWPNEKTSRRAQRALPHLGIATYQLCDFGQVNLTSLCLSFCNCENGSNNTCFSGSLGR